MSLADRYPLLAAIESPADLRRLPESQLEPLVRELRDYLVQTVSQMGGHFAAGLGTVELTVALHYVYETPHDRLVWDVGHQAYPHKVLTGRRDRLNTIKLKDGLAPFPNRSESEYDTFGVGHASTSIGAALGMALGARRAGEARRVVAVIGDGAISGGQAFEAMNHAGPLDPDMLVVLSSRCSICANRIRGCSLRQSGLFWGTTTRLSGASARTAERSRTRSLARAKRLAQTDGALCLRIPSLGRVGVRMQPALNQNLRAAFCKCQQAAHRA